jgi:hypothetical protein
MATVKKGILTASPEWWRHLRSMKRSFWKSERQAAREFIRREAAVGDCAQNGGEDRAEKRPDSN